MTVETPSYRVLTAVGPDRPGLVTAVSAVIHRAGANLEDSRMAVLAGEFALIVLFSGPDDALDRVQREAEVLEREFGFSLTFRTTTPRTGMPEIEQLRLEVTGLDQPGIVRRVSEILAGHKINVSSLETRLSRAAFTGTPLFSLKAELEVSDGRIVGELRSELERACDEWNLSYALDRFDPE